MVLGQVIWNPNHPSQFAVSAEDLRIYSIDDLQSHHSSCRLVSTLDQRAPGFTCISWSPKSIAGGLVSGKIILLDEYEQVWGFFIIPYLYPDFL